MINPVFASFPFYILSIIYRPLLYIGFIVQSAYLVYRGIDLGRLPLVGPHDTLSFLSASIAAFSGAFYLPMKEKKDFFVIIGVLCAIFTFFSVVSAPHNQPLPPVLKTYWFEFHVILSFLSYALFGIGAVLGAVYIRASDAAIERLQYKSILVGYCLFSLSMIFGGVWAYLAWGTYWLWTPKELWTTILWLLYSLYLHTRLMGGLSGRPSAVFGIVGFFIVLFTYLGVGLLMKSSHGF